MRAYIETPAGKLSFSLTGNTKVRFPILSMGAGLDCPSRGHCPFDRDNKDRTGFSLCYAQKAELFRPSVLASRRQNERAIAGSDPSWLAQAVVDRVAAYLDRKGGARILRLNESGDIGPANKDFALALVKAAKIAKVRVYLYTRHRGASLLADLRKEGAIILRSDIDFIGLPKRANVPDSHPLCPGVCGPCTRCPDGLQSSIRFH